MTTTDLAGHVDALVAGASARLSGDEVLLASYSGERSDFVRFNHGAVRQAGSVEQHAIDALDALGSEHVGKLGKRRATESESRVGKRACRGFGFGIAVGWLATRYRQTGFHHADA